MTLNDKEKRAKITHYFRRRPPLSYGLLALLFGALAATLPNELELTRAYIMLTGLALVPKLVLGKDRQKWARIPWQVRRYLSPRYGFFLAALTVVSFMAGTQSTVATLFLALGPLLLVPRGVDQFYRPKDETIDGWLQDDLEAYVDRALTKLNMEEDELDQTPLLVTGPVLNWRDGRQAITRAQDDNLRFAAHHVVVLLLGRTNLGLYRCKFDSRKGVSYDLTTEHIPYNQLAGVGIYEGQSVNDTSEDSTTEDSANRPTPSESAQEPAFKYQAFRVRMPGGGFEIPSRVTDPDTKRRSLTPPGTPLDHAVNALRSKIV